LTEIIGVWRKLHNEELHILYSLPDVIGMIKSRRRHVASIMEKRYAYRIFVGKLAGKKPLGSPRQIWKIRWIVEK
jgi:hypothetical protein